MMKSIVFVALLIALACGNVAFASCYDESGNKVPCEQVPPPEGGGGTGGGTCWAMTCSECDTKQHPVFPDISWHVCPNVAENGGCSRDRAGDK